MKQASPPDKVLFLNIIHDFSRGNVLCFLHGLSASCSEKSLNGQNPFRLFSVSYNAGYLTTRLLVSMSYWMT